MLTGHRGVWVSLVDFFANKQYILDVLRILLSIKNENKQHLSYDWKIFLYLNSLDLGGGWAAAIADDPAELQFFLENNRISSDDNNYWIGGLAYNNTLDDTGRERLIQTRLIRSST